MSRYGYRGTRAGQHTSTTSTLVYCTEERKVEVVMNERTRFRDVALESEIRGPAICFMPDGDESNATRFRNKDSIK